MTEYMKILFTISAFSMLIPCVPAVMMLRRKLNDGDFVYVLWILFAGYTEMMGRLLGSQGINNHWLYSIYTVVEWTAVTYIFIELMHSKRLFSLIPAIAGIYLITDEVLLTKVEMTSLIILGSYTFFILMRRSVRLNTADILLIAGIVFYSFNYLTYGHDARGAELFSYMNITTNIIITLSLGLKCKRYRLYQYSL